MFCRKCGKENADDAIYCQKCGVMLEPEEETRVAGRDYLPPGQGDYLPPRSPDATTPSIQEGSLMPPRPSDYLPPRQRNAATPPVQERSLEEPPRPSDYLPPRQRNAATPPSQGGEQIFSISPTLMFVKMGYVLAAIGALLLVAALTVFAFVPGWLAVLFGLALFLIPAFYHFKQKLILYNLTDSTVEIDTGLMSRNTRNIPLRTIQDVTVSATIWQRILGFGDIVIDNASEQGGKVVLKNINSPRHFADMLLRQMRLLNK